MGALPRLPNTPLAMGQVKTGLPPPGVTPAPADSIALSGTAFSPPAAGGFVDYVYTVDIYVLLC